MASIAKSGDISAQPLARRAIVVDDHPIVAEALVMAIAPMFRRVDTAVSLEAAQALLVADSDCQLAILDLHLQDTHGRETVLGMRERFPDVPILVFTGDNSLDNVTMAFECGVRGFTGKTAPMLVVRNAIRLVIGGGSYIPPEVAELLGFAAPKPLSEPAMTHRISHLTGRQEEVFRLLLLGMPNKVIGARLDMAEGTVKAHLSQVYSALGVHTRVEAILKARHLGII